MADRTQLSVTMELTLMELGAASGSKECLSDWNLESMFERLTSGRIIWKFSFLAAPHFSGNWERLVRRCEKTMFAVLGNRRLTLPVLTTTMCLVEQMLNARPKMRVSGDLMAKRSLRWVTSFRADRGWQICWCLIRSELRAAETHEKCLKFTIRWFGMDGRSKIILSGMCVWKRPMTTNKCWKLQT